MQRPAVRNSAFLRLERKTVKNSNTTLVLAKLSTKQGEARVEPHSLSAGESAEIPYIPPHINGFGDDERSE